MLQRSEVPKQFKYAYKTKIVLFQICVILSDSRFHSRKLIILLLYRIDNTIKHNIIIIKK